MAGSFRRERRFPIIISNRKKVGEKQKTLGLIPILRAATHGVQAAFIVLFRVQTQGLILQSEVDSKPNFLTWKFCGTRLW